MATLGVLKAQIADDLIRSNLSTQIGAAVTAAIHDVETKRFWFNETRSFTLPTVASQTEYDITTGTSGEDAGYEVADFFKIDAVIATVGGQPRELQRRRDLTSMDIDIAYATVTGQPTDYGFFARKLRIYPLPDIVYTLRIEGHFKATALSDDNDSNIWTNEAYELIRSLAGARVLFRPIRNLDLAQQFTSVAQTEMDRLVDETAKRAMTNKIKPVRF